MKHDYALWRIFFLLNCIGSFFRVCKLLIKIEIHRLGYVDNLQVLRGQQITLIHAVFDSDFCNY